MIETSVFEAAQNKPKESVVNYDVYNNIQTIPEELLQLANALVTPIRRNAGKPAHK